MRINEQLRRLDERAMPHLASAFLVSYAVIVLALGLAFRSWRPVGVVAPVIGACAVLELRKRRRSRSGSDAEVFQHLGDERRDR